jgi:hypothetical protein
MRWAVALRPPLLGCEFPRAVCPAEARKGRWRISMTIRSLLRSDYALAAAVLVAAWLILSSPWLFGTFQGLGLSPREMDDLVEYLKSL